MVYCNTLKFVKGKEDKKGYWYKFTRPIYGSQEIQCFVDQSRRYRKPGNQCFGATKWIGDGCFDHLMSYKENGEMPRQVGDEKELWVHRQSCQRSPTYFVEWI